MPNHTLIWKDNVPFSQEFGDVYFSADDGLAESMYVFIGGNKLIERWQNAAGNFTIIETGFGTGLNFFACLAAWEKHAPDNLTLNYISIEKYPLAIGDIQKAIANWPELDCYMEEFARLYPQAKTGKAELSFKDGKVKLTLIWQDVKDALNVINIKADAWFLDGFSPAKNPDMWNDDLYKAAYGLTANKGTFATFTVAGHVRRGLQNAGFTVQKIKGFGKKREMLAGVNSSQ